MSGEKAGAEVFIRDKELAWVPARLLDQTPDKANVSVASYTDELDIDLGGKGATKWTDASVNLKDYAEFGKQLPLQNNKILDDMVDLPYLHEVRSFLCLRVEVRILGTYLPVKDILDYLQYCTQFSYFPVDSLTT